MTRGDPAPPAAADITTAAITELVGGPRGPRRPGRGDKFADQVAAAGTKLTSPHPVQIPGCAWWNGTVAMATKASKAKATA